MFIYIILVKGTVNPQNNYTLFVVKERSHIVLEHQGRVNGRIEFSGELYLSYMLNTQR